MATKRPKHGRTVSADTDKLLAILNQSGLTVEQLAERADCSVGTVNNLLKGKASYRQTLSNVAGALNIPLAVLISASNEKSGSTTIHEYLISDVLTDWTTASNGLRFQVCRLRHLELDRLARGKRFDLRDLPTDEEQRCRTWIKRHPKVCDAIGNHPNIARNITAFYDPTESFYWVIDEWIEGEPLARVLRAKSTNKSFARQLMLDTARGLAALHREGIIRRELSPASVMISDADGHAVLTEFELAKLIDRGPTVSNDQWPADPYRAGEADSDDVDERADVYSWGRIATHALTGELPTPGSEAEVLNDSRVSPAIGHLLLSSTSVLRSQRPPRMQQVIEILEAADYYE